ncbi:MAG: sulfite exporter TauE/SafE family protein [Bacteroidetes bacterium]|nr:MAG: sulfite exporter TauE/SafE family protein [Bacteroidota bacterium]
MEFFAQSDSFGLSPFDWFLALLAAFIVGLAKAGIKGITVLLVTLLAFIFGGKASTGILLPMLTVGDIFAIWYYNKHAQWHYLWKLLPSMAVGVLIGVYVGKDLPEDLFKQGMAVIILVTVVMMIWWDQRKDIKIPDHPLIAPVTGLLAGFTTMVGNLAGAFTNIYFLAMRLPKEQFIGTAAWLFFFINLFKMPFHIFVWETMSVQTLALNFRLLPGIFLGLWTGVILVKKIHNRHYRKLILILTGVGALALLFR